MSPFKVACYCAVVCFLLVAECSAYNAYVRHQRQRSGSRAAAASRRQPEDVLVAGEFEDEQPQLRSYSLRTSGPNIDACEFKICEHVADYPEKEIATLVHRTPHLVDSYFGQLSGPLSRGIVKGWGEGDAEWDQQQVGENVCRTSARQFAPRALRNVKGDLRYIININDTKYQMTITGEVCSREGEPCRDAIQRESSGIRCLQKYGVIKLLSYQLGANALAYDYFKYPISCVCHRYNNY